MSRIRLTAHRHCKWHFVSTFFCHAWPTWCATLSINSVKHRCPKDVYRSTASDATNCFHIAKHFRSCIDIRRLSSPMASVSETSRTRLASDENHRKYSNAQRIVRLRSLSSAVLPTALSRLLSSTYWYHRTMARLHLNANIVVAACPMIRLRDIFSAVRSRHPSNAAHRPR